MLRRLGPQAWVRIRAANMGTRAFTTSMLNSAPKKATSDAARARRRQTRTAPSKPPHANATRAPRPGTAAPPNLERLTASKATAPKDGSSSSGAARAAQEQTATSPKSAAAAPPMRGRFNRIASSKGLAFASYLYILGEGTTLGLTLLLQFNLLGIGEVGTWLGALGIPADQYLNIGPTILGLQLSPRLLLNYMIANACCYPLYRFQYAFCEATAPVFASAWRPVRRVLQARKEKTNTIPKAPSPKAE